MYLGRDFADADAGETGTFVIDFISKLQGINTAIVSAQWFCAATSGAEDADAQSHIDGPAVISGTKVSQRISGLRSGTVYCLTATATTAEGDVVSMWSRCVMDIPAGRLWRAA